MVAVGVHVGNVDMPEPLREISSIGGPSPASVKPSVFVADPLFVAQIKQYRSGRNFLLEEGIRFEPDHLAALDLTDLYMLRFKESGETVNREQWTTLDKAERTLALYFTPELRRKFRLKETRGVIGRWPLLFLTGALASFLASVILPPYFLSGDSAHAAALSSLGAYLIWTISLGGLGAAAFLAVNSLGIQSDTSFDMGDKALIFMRLVVGSLFGFILSLPVSLPAFARFAAEALGAAGTRSSDVSLETVALILLPFFLGFSTSLVLTVMNRFVSAVETFFGVKGAPVIEPAPPSPARTDARRDGH